MFAKTARHIVILAIALFAPACLNADSTTLRRDPRIFEPHADKVAAALHEEVRRHPKDQLARRALSDHYAKLGYATLSTFYASTADVLINQTAVPNEVPTVAIWACPADESERTRALARLIESTMLGGDYESALAKAVASRRDLGDSCDLLVSWADALRVSTESKQNQVGPEDRELMLRVLFTLAIEGQNVPGYLPGVPDVYYSLSQYFSSVEHDQVAAYVAVRTGLALLDRSPLASTSRAPYVERLKKLEATLQK
ncbi:MAG: hypothetical protein WC538_24805 [Thermoanaerobaculia bacterium]|jgi:hypothetical protein